MRIKRMTASFGRLDHETLNLESGLNILTMPNEGGKSTWCAFLRVMLYGLDTHQRDKKGVLADKSRYMPWNGGPMEGELVCEWQGRDLVVRRYPANGVPMGGFEAVWADTGDPVPGLTADSLGDILIGVSRSVFERSAFVGQASFPVSQTPELEKRLSALVSSGEEDVSAIQVRDQLAQWQRRRQFRGKGRIPELETRRDQLNGRLREIYDATENIREHREQIDRLEELETQLARQERLHEALREDAQAHAYAQAEQELRTAQAKLEKLQAQIPASGLPEREALEKGRDDLAALKALDATLKQNKNRLPEAEAALTKAKAAAQDSIFSGEAADVRTAARTVRSQCEKLERTRKRLSLCTWLCPVVCLVAAAVSCIVSLAVWNTVTLSAGMLAVGLVLLGAVLAMLFQSTGKSSDAERAALLEQYHADSGAEVTEAAERYCARMGAVARAEEDVERARQGESGLREQREQLWTGVRDLVVTFAPEVKDVLGFSAAIGRYLTLLNDIALARQEVDGAQKVYDAVAAHGRGTAGPGLEQPSVTLEQAQAGLKEARRRSAVHQSELSMAMGRQKTLGEPEAVQAELDAVERELETNRMDCEALNIAMEALEQAESELRERFSPQLNAKAGRYMRRLTGGKYDGVHVSRTLEAGAEEAGGVATRDVLTLSQGTADQLWLAVRLAVCDLALPEDEACPLVLDDALVNFDDDRVIPALKLLEDLAQKRQVLLFSCHEREARLYGQMHRGEDRA